MWKWLFFGKIEVLYFDYELYCWGWYDYWGVDGDFVMR